MDEDGEISTLLERMPSTDACSDVVGNVQVRDVLEALSGKDRELADLLMHGYTTQEAGGITGENPRKNELMRAKIRESEKSMWVFRRRYEEYEYRLILFHQQTNPIT